MAHYELSAGTMDISDYKDIYTDPAENVTNLLERLNSNEPEKSVIKSQESASVMLEHRHRPTPNQ